MLVNLTIGQNDKSELIDKSAEEVVSAWAALKKKGNNNKYYDLAHRVDSNVVLLAQAALA